MKFQAHLIRLGWLLMFGVITLGCRHAVAGEKAMLGDAINQSDMDSPASVSSVDVGYERLRTDSFRKYCVLREISRALTEIFKLEHKYPEADRWMHAVANEAKDKIEMYGCLPPVMDEYSQLGVEYIYKDFNTVIIYSKSLVQQVRADLLHEALSLKAGGVKGKLLEKTHEGYVLHEPE